MLRLVAQFARNTVRRDLDRILPDRSLHLCRYRRRRRPSRHQPRSMVSSCRRRPELNTLPGVAFRAFSSERTVVETTLLIVFPALMAYAAASDLLTMRIPNWLSLALVAAFAFIVAAGGLPWEALPMHAAAAALVLAVCFALFAFGWMGGGDAKLAAATALWLGFPSLMDYLLMAALAGGVLTARHPRAARLAAAAFRLGLGLAVPPARSQERRALRRRAGACGPHRLPALPSLVGDVSAPEAVPPRRRHYLRLTIS